MTENKVEKIKAGRQIKEIMTQYYMEAKNPNSNKKIAWITSGGPVEPLFVMDIIPIYPENHSAMIGALKMGGDLCRKAEEMGYSNDLCSYAKADIACATINGGPIGGLPKPDMLICCNNICGTVLKWYEVQARYFNVPLFIIDTPVCHTSMAKEAKEYVKAQINEYIKFLEIISNKKFDYDKLEEIGLFSFTAQKLWQKILDTTIHSPAPMSAFDAFFHLALIVTLRGKKQVVDYYQKLLNEMNQRIKRKISTVKNETHRLLWDNLPIWHKTRWLSDKFASHNGNFVADTYTAAWCSSLKFIDKTNFLDSMAQAYTKIYLNKGVDQMAQDILKMIDKYRIDGVVMHSNRSCKPYSFGQYDIQKIIQKQKKIPVIILESDMTDERLFSKSQVETRIDAFIEILDTSIL
ncbi:MAG: 2-hydroxyglutaryl-CoA dehydratase [Desulfobacteraceae bacterium 4572_130]|nr:MAG: 2-hydroxyglutaryl-CoA dehydratase [Desulfobacteraceae bacterium 4572_130]